MMAEDGIPLRNWGMICCRNCGHESHCGIKLMKDFRGSSGNGGIEGQIEVCKSCRCEECEGKTETSWPGPGV